MLNLEGISLIPLLSDSLRIKALKLLGIYGKVGDSKLDIAIMGNNDAVQAVPLENGRILGGIHAKVSLAERVSDDVPASKEMMANGFASFLVTLDVKSFPLSGTMTSQTRAYLNNGEPGTPDRPTDKRKYIEEHGSFDACFSYNLRTVPSPSETPSGKRIYVGRFDGKQDELYRALINLAGKA